MTKKKITIDYRIVEIKNGSNLLLATNDKEVADAINQFMIFQSIENRIH